MNAYLKVLGTGLATVFLASSFAFAAQVSNQPTGTGTMNPNPPMIKVSCQVAGTPSEFPDDVTIYNDGTSNIAKGTKFHWKVAFANKQGDYALKAILKPKHGEMISGALPGGVEAGKPCTVAVK